MSATSDYKSIDQGPDSIIKRYNNTWLDHKQAWVTQDRSTAGQSQFTVVSSLRTWPYIAKPTESYVLEVYKQALAFLSYYDNYLDPVHINSHWSFFQHLERSFDQEKCEREINTKDLRNRIFDIRRRCLGSYQEGQLSFSALFKEYGRRIPHKDLPYSGTELQLCNLMIFAGPAKTPIPAGRAQLFKRSEAWKKLINPILEQKTPLNAELHFQHHSAGAMLQLITLIHSGKQEIYPNQLSELIALASLAQEVQENEVFDHCLSKAEELIAEHSAVGIHDFCRKMESERIPERFAKLLGSKRSEVLWKRDPSLLSQDELLCLLEQDCAPIPELKILELLEEWEKAQKDDSIERQGDLLKRKLSDGPSLLERVRFEHIDLDEYITQVMTRVYIPMETRLFYLSAIQMLSTPGSTIRIKDWTPRMDRYKQVRIETDYEGDGNRVKVTVRIPVSPANRFLTGRQRTEIVTSESFTLFGRKAYFELSEQLKKGKNHFGIFLRITGLSKDHPLRLKDRFAVSGNGKETHCSGENVWEGNRGWGRALDNHSLAALVESGYVTMTADLTKVEESSS